MLETAPNPTARQQRLAELVDRLPVLLNSLVDALANDAGDNPATFVLASVALEAARELQELEPSHV